MSEASLHERVSVESLVARVADEFRERQSRGERPDIEEYAARHPEAADLLRKVLASLELLQASLSGGGLPAGDSGEELVGTLGDFRIIREVGRGGMGIVYEAEQLSLGRRVALKVLPFAATMDPRQLQRFHNEARAAASLHHTNIVPVYAVGVERGVHYYAMQFIDGTTLAAMIADLRKRGGRPALPEEQPTTPHVPGAPAADTAERAATSTARARPDPAYFRRVAEWGIQVAEALDHAHQLGIVHRDVKPANLLVDGRGGLWVTDFGLAHIQSDARLTMTGDLVGTLRYMSPEQALAKRVVIDHRTDVYSLGATLYELLTLGPAFAGNDRQELLRQIAFEEPKPPRRSNKAIPAELETIVLKAMEKNPAERYVTAKELADDLRRFLTNQPIRARRPTVIQRARKLAARHQALAGSAAVVLLLAVTMLAGTLGWAASRRAERRRGTEQVVTQALEESASWQEKRRLPEALSAARRAAGLVAGGEADEALRRRVQARVDDLELLARLEEVRLEMAAARDGNFDLALGDRRFVEVFREASLDVAALSTAEAGERLRGTTVAVELAAVLDEWFVSCRSHGNLLQVARAADADGWRTRLREALERRDREALLDLASSNEAKQQQASTLFALGGAIAALRAVAQAEALLREAQHQHPDDFWINESLGMQLRSSTPPRNTDAIPFLRSAVALRPQSSGARVNLGVALQDSGDVDGAVAEYKEAVRLKQDYAEAHYNLGIALGAKGDVDGAIAEYKKAISIKQDCAEAHCVLGAALLDNKGDADGAVAEFREAARLKQDYAVAHNNLGNALRAKADVDGAVAEYKKAISIDKDFALAHHGLGIALQDKGDVDGAVAEYKEAIRLKQDFASAHYNLGCALGVKGDVDGAIAACKEAIRLKQDYAEAHCKLGISLKDKGDLDGAVAEFREAARLKQDYAVAHNNLGSALRVKADVDGAIAEYKKAISINKDYADPHSNLGATLLDNKGDVDGAVAEFREAARLNKDNASAHYNLGNALGVKGDVDGAIAEYKKAISIKQDYAEAHCNLGKALELTGQFAEALTYRRRGHELGSKRPRWPFPSAQWVKECERLVELDARLPKVLKGEVQPADVGERLGLAQFCQLPCKSLHTAAVRFYSDAFAEQPELADDLQHQLRYNAACAAALAGCGHGKGADGLPDKDYVRLRTQALRWLRDDLTAWRKVLEKFADKARPAVQQQMTHWLQDADFTGVRGSEALAKLPESERGEWQRLWEEVEALRKQAAQVPKPAAAGRP